jgi:serine protease Do
MFGQRQQGWVWFLLLVVALQHDAAAATFFGQKAKKPASPSYTAESLATLARPAVVVISQRNRDGEEQGIGAGVAIGSNLIATCLHVIGEARPFSVRLESGERREATEIFAWDRKLDLAIVRVEGDKLKSMPMGDSDELKQGAQVVAVGNPLGLEHSIVQGVISGKREFEDVEMLQLAIPIEPGNSGGPLLDMEGRVQGLLSMKSALSANLGFAVPVNALKKLVEKPNPVPMSRWLSFTTVRTNQWLPIMGARWNQRAGSISVEGAGDGFGGRSLLISRAAVPKPPYEVAVEVKLDDESGAAGLIFESDGGDLHYGFYPTGGQLRLTRFEGPTVFTWNILSTIGSTHYRPGEWNHLRVRVEEEKLECYVNGQLAIESDDPRLTGGKVGLAKFRHTKATFRHFAVGTNLATAATPQTASAVLPDNLKSDAEVIRALKVEPDSGYQVLQQRSRELERESERLRNLARKVHERRVTDEITELLSDPDAKTDLFHAALLVSRLDNADLDVNGYRQHFDEFVREFTNSIPAKTTDGERVEALKKFLFTDHGFHGSRADYYSRANSYIDRVLEDREGIPITLSVLFMEMARRAQLDVAGIPLPGHFIVKHTAPEGDEHFLDVFNGGARLTSQQVEAIVLENGGTRLMDEHVQPATKRDIIIRMLRNLLRARPEHDAKSGLGYLDVIVALAPDSVLDRIERARLRLAAGDTTGAREDLAWILDHEPKGLDLDAVRQLYRSL